LTFVFIGEKEPLRAFGRCQEQHLGRTVAFAKIQNVSKRRNKRAKSFTRSGVEMSVVWGITGSVVSIRQEKRFDKLCRFCVWNVKYPKVCVIIRLYLFIDSLIK
jgi:hypothetical protein